MRWWARRRYLWSEVARLREENARLYIQLGKRIGQDGAAPRRRHGDKSPGLATRDRGPLVAFRRWLAFKLWREADRERDPGVRW